MSNGATTWNYSYDPGGMRTGRTSGTTTYSYVYNGSQLMQMTCGSDTLNFTYDANSLPLTVTYQDTTYYYVTNLQGDVVCIINKSGVNEVVYEYDAWGNILSTDGFMADTLGQLNPLRYRGYVYDTETDLYYLQSRYYDPKVGRFLNADAYITTDQGLMGNNMYAYCGNSPTNMMDPTGDIPVSIVSGGIRFFLTGPALIRYLYNSKIKINGYIYDQNASNVSKLWFGVRRSSKNGCGWIATYNALLMLGRYIEPAKIIAEYEKSGAILKGVLGLDPLAIRGFFARRGYKVTVTTDTSKFDSVAKKNTANIVFYWHSKGAHNVAIRWNGSQFLGYNTYSGGSGPYHWGKSIHDKLIEKGWSGAILFSIS